MAFRAWWTQRRIEVLVWWKRLLSYRRQDWDLADYPVVIRTQELADEPLTVRLDNRYLAYVVNWFPCGTGPTPAQAMRVLEERFKKVKRRRKMEGLAMVRPGVNAPLEFATAVLINTVPTLRDDFIHRVLELEWAVLSDESTLWDFHDEPSNDRLVAKIREVYGVDVSDIDPPLIVRILERIDAARPRS